MFGVLSDAPGGFLATGEGGRIARDHGWYRHQTQVHARRGFLDLVDQVWTVETKGHFPLSKGVYRVGVLRRQDIFVQTPLLVQLLKLARQRSPVRRPIEGPIRECCREVVGRADERRRREKVEEVPDLPGIRAADVDRRHLSMALLQNGFTRSEP